MAGKSWHQERILSKRKGSNFKLAKKIVAEKGIRKGLYAGGIPSFSKSVAKHFYRYPLFVILPKFYKDNLPEKFKDNV